MNGWMRRLSLLRHPRGVALHWVLVCLAPAVGAGPIGGIHLDLKLRTGGAVSGELLDHDAHAVVVFRDQTPYVFSWRELEFASALAARRAIVTSWRGGEDKLNAEDYFQLGAFALSLGRNDAAVYEFRHAQRLDRGYAPRIRAAFDEFRKRRPTAADADPFESESEADPATEPAQVFDLAALVSPTAGDVREQVLDAYRQFGGKVQEVLGGDVVGLESDHFLIWTDWEKPDRERLIEWCEAMYAALCQQFDIAPTAAVFLAKCPVFCFRSKAKFRRFSRYFDGYDGGSATGYTRSVEKNGHVHVVLLRQGQGEIDLERFACTLVHEGTHAFVHRLYSHRLIPPWVNEGLAELTAERVLGERCDTRETAELLARQYARFDWPLGGLLDSNAPLEVHQYPLAHSVVAYLEGRGRGAFAGFLRELKEGRTVAEALAGTYDGLTVTQLESQWRSAQRIAAQP